MRFGWFSNIIAIISLKKSLIFGKIFSLVCCILICFWGVNFGFLASGGLEIQSRILHMQGKHAAIRLVSSALPVDLK